MDIFGQALSDYYFNPNEAPTLWLNNSYGEPEEMPVDVFFRTEDEMPDMELLAMSYCRGKVLDIGAGTGSHAVYLQRRGLDVNALEISPEACEIMRLRDVRNVINGDIFQYEELKYDTLLLMMNGIGLCESLPKLRTFLQLAKGLLTDDGQIIFDSSDIAYLYEGNLPQTGKYYGEISYQYEYKGTKGPWFNWLYIDRHTMSAIARQEGWSFSLLNDDGEDQYLAKLILA